VDVRDDEVRVETWMSIGTDREQTPESPPITNIER
jgi:hypothetical protein